MIEVILLVLVFVLIISVFGLFLYIKSSNTNMKRFVIAKINDLITKINQSKLYEFNYLKQKDEYLKQLDQQVRTISSFTETDS